MEAYQVAQFLWTCLSAKYPEIGGAVLQVIGGGTVLFRLLGSTRLGISTETPILGKLLSVFKAVALNK